MKPKRQIKHRDSNTHTFKTFTEKIRKLRVSARTYLLKRPRSHEVGSRTHLYEALIRARELNLTQDFQNFQNDLGSEIQTTAQLVLREAHICSTLDKHLRIKDSTALHPILDILVAFSCDLPREFYPRRFYEFLPLLTQQLRSKVPEDIEAVFVCLVALFVTGEKALTLDIKRLYFVEGFNCLLSSSYPWYVNELAAQAFSFLVRRLPDGGRKGRDGGKIEEEGKDGERFDEGEEREGEEMEEGESEEKQNSKQVNREMEVDVIESSKLTEMVSVKREFLGLAFRKLGWKDEHPQHTEGLGRLLAAMMRSDVPQRLHSSTPKILRHLLGLIGTLKYHTAQKDAYDYTDTQKHPPKSTEIHTDTQKHTEKRVDAVKFAVLQICHHVTAKHSASGIRWEDGWAEDSHMVFPVFWQVIEDALLSLADGTPSTDTQSSDTMPTLKPGVLSKIDTPSPSLKNGSLSKDTLNHLHNILQVLQVILEYKGGCLVTNFKETAEILIRIANVKSSSPTHLPTELSETLAYLLASLLTSRYNQVTSDGLHKVINGLLTSQIGHEVKLSFLQKLFDMERFDSEVLPTVLNFLHRLVCVPEEMEGGKKKEKGGEEEMEEERENEEMKKELGNGVVKFLSTLALHKQVLCKTGMCLETWRKYPMDFSVAIERHRKSGEIGRTKEEEGKMEEKQGKNGAKKRKGGTEGKKKKKGGEKEKGKTEEMEQNQKAPPSIPSLITSKLKSLIDKVSKSNVNEGDLSELIHCLFTVPHITPINTHTVNLYLSEFLVGLLDKLKGPTKRLVEEGVGERGKGRRRSGKEEGRKGIKDGAKIEGEFERTEAAQKGKITLRKGPETKSGPTEPFKPKKVIGSKIKLGKTNVKEIKKSKKKVGNVAGFEVTVNEEEEDEGEWKEEEEEESLKKKRGKKKTVGKKGREKEGWKTEEEEEGMDEEMERIWGLNHHDNSIDLNIQPNLSIEQRKYAIVLGCVVECMGVLLTPREFVASMRYAGLMKVLRECPHLRYDIHYMRALDIYLTVAMKERESPIYSERFLELLYPVLAPCLGSHVHQIRLLSVHILSLFPVMIGGTAEQVKNSEEQMKKDERKKSKDNKEEIMNTEQTEEIDMDEEHTELQNNTEQNSEPSIFEIMLKAELTPCTPYTYKDRVRHISSLDASLCTKHTPNSRHYTMAPLLYLIGQLYINYKEIWSPVLKAIGSWGNSLSSNIFWPVWYSNLLITSHATARLLRGEEEGVEEKIMEREIERREKKSGEKGGMMERKTGEMEQIPPNSLSIPLFGSNDILNQAVEFLETHMGFEKLPPLPDFLNFRDLLWSSMERFPDVCEERNRDLVPLFFAFVERELFPFDFTVAPSQDLRCRGEREKEEEEMEEGEKKGEEIEKERGMEERESEENEGIEEGMETEIIEKEIKQGKRSKKSEKIYEKTGHGFNIQGNDEKTQGQIQQDRPAPRRAPIKSLCVQLSLFAKFRNPIMLSNTNKLKNLYMELLSHPSPQIQRLSLDCLLSYNPSYLVPYKESLHKLLDDRGFKNALTLFTIDGADQKIEEGHREDLMPYLMRILYGKMHYRTGPNSSGKSKIGVRKATILRFLAGARDSEITTFLDLAFDVIIPHLSDSALLVVTQAHRELDLSRIVPLSRMQGALTTLENIIDKIGNLLKSKVSYLLKIVLYILMTVSAALENRVALSDRNISFLKHLRGQAQRLVLAFFRRYSDYRWNLDELDADFEALVWPNLSRLGDEGIVSPTPMLQLFALWASVPRFWPLLARYHPSDSTLSPLPYIVKVLAHPKCSQSVADLILTLIGNLLDEEKEEAKRGETERREEEMEETERRNEGEGKTDNESLPISPYTLKVTLKSNENKLQSFGSALLTPHLNTILFSMKKYLNKLGKGEVISTRDLGILTTLTEWSEGEDISKDLVGLIIPLVVRRHVRKEERLAQLLTICGNLLRNLDAGPYLQALVGQFATLSGRETRSALVSCMRSIALRHPELQKVSEISIELNAWNLRMVDQIDYERRLSCYRELGEYFKTQKEINTIYCLNVMYNSIYFLSNAGDASLRDVATLCLSQLIDFCAGLHSANPRGFKEVIIDKFLPRLKPLLRSEKEIVRMEGLGVLRHAVIKCHDLTDKLTDLHKLVDLTEENRDFFLNLSHIQRHRRARAISKLSDQLSAGTLTLSTDTLNFLLPFITVYLFKEQYSGDDYLIRSCVSCLGSIAKLLPWYPYQKLLKYYLGMVMKGDLKYLKQSVKIIDEILNAFHEEVEVIVGDEGKSEGMEIGGKAGKKRRRNGEKIEVKGGRGGKKVELEGGKRGEKGEMEGGKRGRAKGGKVDTGKMEEELEEMGETAERTEEEMEESGAKEGENTPILSHPQKVFRSLVHSIIPQIERTLSARSKIDTEHKSNQNKYPEDEEIKRIPLAYALVKMLKRLPKELLDLNISNVFMKLITFLKSKSEGIREEARSMLVKIMVELGGDYLKYLVSDLHTILNQGFQYHVLVFTLHAILSKLRPVLTPSHIDNCMGKLIEICKEDLLGVQAEEKDIKEITNKVKEARQHRSYEILHFVAEFISKERLRDIIEPLREILGQTEDRKVVNKMHRCLKEIASGLDQNTNIEITQKSIFIYGVLNDRINVSGVKAQTKAVPQTSKKPDSFLLKPDPKRGLIAPKTTLKSTSYLLTDFALQLLATLMRRERFKASESDHINLLDPYVGIIDNFIDSEHPEVSIEAIKCINCLIRYPLPSLDAKLPVISNHLFVILHKFSSPELGHGKVYDLVQLTFKSLAAILKSVPSYNLTEEQLKVLLEYISGNLEDSGQQQTAFTVLQALLARKFTSPELHSILRRVKEMSVTCTRIYGLQQARLTFYNYILNYPLKKKQINFIILYFLGNVSYDIEEGRFSALTMLNAIISKFPIKMFNQKLESNIWFSISSQLLSEVSKENLVLLSRVLKSLYQRSKRREMLVELCGKLLKSPRADYVAFQLSARSLSAFLDAPAKRVTPALLSEIAPQLAKLIDPSRYHNSLVETEQDLEVTKMDSALSYILEVLQKLVGLYKNQEELELSLGTAFWGNIQAQLKYPHVKVRLGAVSLVGKLLSMYPIDGTRSPGFCMETEAARGLVLDLIEVLKTEAPSDTQLLKQISLGVVRNLIYLIRQASKVPLVKRKEEREGEEGEMEEEEEEDERDIEEMERKEEKKMEEEEEEGKKEEGMEVERKKLKKSEIKRGKKKKERELESEKSEIESEESKSDSKKRGKKRKRGGIESVKEKKGRKRLKSESENEKENSNESKPSSDNSNKEGSSSNKSKSPSETQNSPITSNLNPLIPSAKWVLHRVGNLAYEELKKYDTERMQVRESLLNLIAGLIVLLGSEIKAPHIFNYIIKHLGRELSDEHLPKGLKVRTDEVAGLLRECVGVEMYAMGLTRAQSALTKKRLVRKAGEKGQIATNPVLSQMKKNKKREAMKESRKRKIAERKGKILNTGNKKNKLKEQAILNE